MEGPLLMGHREGPWDFLGGVDKGPGCALPERATQIPSPTLPLFLSS